MLFLYESVGFDYISGGSLEPLLVKEIYDDHTINSRHCVQRSEYLAIVKGRERKKILKSEKSIFVARDCYIILWSEAIWLL